MVQRLQRRVVYDDVDAARNFIYLRLAISFPRFAYLRAFYNVFPGNAFDYLRERVD